LTDQLTFPNGVAFAPGGRQLYVSVSDPQNPVIMRYDLNSDGTLGPGQVFFDAKPLADEGRKGLPDGLKTDLRGNVFATGPGGVLVLSPEGQLLGIINTGEAIANCAWGNDGSVLYLTSHGYLCRVKTWTRGFDRRCSREAEIERAAGPTPLRSPGGGLPRRTTPPGSSLANFELANRADGGTVGVAQAAVARRNSW
jgi:hypothetical protein